MIDSWLSRGNNVTISPTQGHEPGRRGFQARGAFLMFNFPSLTQRKKRGKGKSSKDSLCDYLSINKLCDKQVKSRLNLFNTYIIIYLQTTGDHAVL
jgi:hypothetical protein